MKYDELRDYFDTYIVNYQPYKDDLIYQHLTTFLLDYYFNHSYNQIPLEFRTLYENQIITFDLYDYILTSNGFPEDVVNNMQLRDKSILISSFMDFNKYKGTIEIVRRVANLYSEKFNIYELFIDYDETINDWVFVPYLIYECPELSHLKITKVFDFDYITFNTKLFFITREYLDGLKNNSEIVFPIKTNLVFLDYVELYDENDLTKLLATIVFNTYKSNKIILYFEDGNYQISLENAYKLWYYVIFKAYKNLTLKNLPGAYIQFNVNKPNFPFSLSDIPIIKREYSEIDSRKKLSAFRRKYLEVFDEIQINTNNFTSEQLCTLYENVLDPSLIEYINFKLAENTINYPEKLLINADYILDQIYNSFITWEYEIYNVDSFEYIGYFLFTLPLMYLKFESTTPYILIDYLKPYHVELIVRNQDMVKIKNKFNQAYIDIGVAIKINSLYSTLSNFSYTFNNNVISEINDNFPIINSKHYSVEYRILDKIFDTKSKHNVLVNHINVSSANISENYSSSMSTILNDNFIIENHMDHHLSIDRTCDYKINHNISITYTPP